MVATWLFVYPFWGHRKLLTALDSREMGYIKSQPHVLPQFIKIRILEKKEY